MLQPSENSFNNPNSGLSKRRIAAEMRASDTSRECLRQYLEHTRQSLPPRPSVASQLAFLETAKLDPKSGSMVMPNPAAREAELLPLVSQHPASSPDQNTKSDPHVAIYRSLPIYAGWFNFDRIHSIEQQNLPEFFGEKPSKTPKIYQKLRNFLVTLYWKNPKTPLHGTTARRCVALDAPTTLRVHAFLETWGLINSQARTKPQGSDFSLDFVRQSPVFPPKAPPSAFRETTFETSVIENSFRLLGITRPKCFQCQIALQLFWFGRTAELQSDSEAKVHPIQPERCLNLCPACHSQENFPVFFKISDFKRVSLADLVASILQIPEPKLLENTHENGSENNHICGHQLQFDSGQQIVKISLHEAILQELTEKRLDNLTYAQLRQSHPDISDALLLSTILAVLEACHIDQSLLEVAARAGQSRTKTDLYGKMSRIFESLSERLGGTGEHASRGKSREHTLKPLLKFSRDMEAAFAAKAQKTALRLAFMEDFERVLVQEKQNLKTFN